MNAAQFRTEAVRLIESYWRVRAGFAAYKQLTDIGTTGALQLDFVQVPEVGAVRGLLVNESVQQAQDQLQTYLNERLSTDLFMALVAVFESRLATVLASHGLQLGGTLGAQQRRIEAAVAVPPDLIEDLDEVRERRNSWIHNHGNPDQKYVHAALRVHPRAPLYVPPVSVGDHVQFSAEYLTYAADVLIRYSNAV